MLVNMEFSNFVSQGENVSGNDRVDYCQELSYIYKTGCPVSGLGKCSIISFIKESGRAVDFSTSDDTSLFRMKMQ